MYSFNYVLRRSMRNEDKAVWYSEADGQALYRLIKKYYEENPDITEKEIYENIMELFIKTNAELVKIPTIKSDTFRYNMCKELNRDSYKRKEAYDKVHREEASGRKVTPEDTAVYSANKLCSARTLTMQGLLGLRAQHAFFSEEMQNSYRNFFKASKKFQNDYKRTLSSTERRQLDTLRELFEGDEYTQYSLFLKQSEAGLEKELKGDHIATILFLGDRLKDFGLLEKYHDVQGKLYRALGVDALSYPLSGKHDDTISIEDLFTREVLEKLDINKLSMLSAFWMNRFTKELDALNKSLCIVNQLDLWQKVKDAPVNQNTGMINVDVDKEKLKAVYRKIHFLQEASLVMMDSFDEKEEEFADEIIDGMTSKKVIKRIDPSSHMKAMDFTMGEGYAEYFSALLPGEHRFLQEFDNYRVIENAIHNAYRFKDFNMIAILANLHENNFSSNWGIIKEEGKSLDRQDKVLIGIDVEGFNMPIRLHIDKDMVIDFLKASRGTTIIPEYEGAKDFFALGKNISTPVLMPMCQRQKEGIKHLRERKNGSVSSRDFVEHIAFLADSKDYPDHLKVDGKVRKKGKVKFVRKRPDKKYIDLVTGDEFVEGRDGELQPIVPEDDSKAR